MSTPSSLVEAGWPAECEVASAVEVVANEVEVALEGDPKKKLMRELEEKPSDSSFFNFLFALSFSSLECNRNQRERESQK